MMTSVSKECTGCGNAVCALLLEARCRHVHTLPVVDISFSIFVADGTCRAHPKVLTVGQMLAEPSRGLLVVVSYRQGKAHATAPLAQCSS